MYKIVANTGATGWDLIVTNPAGTGAVTIEEDVNTLDGVLSSIIHNEKGAHGRAPSVSDIEFEVHVKRPV